MHSNIVLWSLHGRYYAEASNFAQLPVQRRSFLKWPLLKAPTRGLPSVDPSKIPESSLTAPVPRNGDRQGDPSGFLFEPQTWEEGILVLLTGFLARHLALMSPRLAAVVGAGSGWRFTSPHQTTCHVLDD